MAGGKGQINTTMSHTPPAPSAKSGTPGSYDKHPLESVGHAADKGDVVSLKFTDDVAHQDRNVLTSEFAHPVAGKTKKD